jgi:hypothetical protein
MKSHPILPSNMQPTRRQRVAQQLGFGDQFAEWLIHKCPFTTLTLLSLIVIASAITFERPWLLIAVTALADLALSVLRRSRRRPARATRVSA